MLSVVIPLCALLLGVACVLTVWRLIRGPSAPDRVLALDTLFVLALALLLLLGLWLKSRLVVEAALLIAVMGFVGTVALCKYLQRGDIIE